MARRGGTDLVELVVLLGVGWFVATYLGVFGEEQKCNLRRNLGVKDPTCLGGGTGGGTGGGGTQPVAGKCCTSNIPAASYIQATQNTNIIQQIAEWQQQRRARGENPCDWAAFRAHLTTRELGAPDPGPNPFIEFCQGMF